LSRTFSHMQATAAFSTLLLFCNALPAAAIELPQVVRQTMAVYFEKPDGDRLLSEMLNEPTKDPRFQKKAGVFVTLSRHGKSRACWGSVDSDGTDLVQSTVRATLEALNNEYRYKPVSVFEWKTLKPQVTIINEVEPIVSIRSLNPLRDGLLVRAGGKSGVLLPGEASDAVYELVQCKLKAGIKPGEPCQLFRLKAQIYE
jgi:AMMECR1 domain-containing protein